MAAQLSRKLLSLFFLLIIVACDFTPVLHKKVLEAQNYIKAQNYKKAIAVYEQILEDSGLPTDLKIKIEYQLGELYSIHMFDNKKAIHYYSLIKEKSLDPFWQVKVEDKMAEIYFSYLKDFKESTQSYKRLSGFMPRLEKFDQYQHRLALSHLFLGKFDESRAVFDEISKNSSHEFYVRSFYYLGLIKFEEKKWAEAIAIWKDYLKKENRRQYHIETKFMMANAFETMEELKSAYNLYYSLLGEYPNTEVIQARLSSIYSRRIARKR